MEKVIQEIEANHERYLQEMIELLRFPSISPGRPHPEAITGAADWLEQRLRRAGLDEVRQLKVDGGSPVGNGRVVQGREQGGGAGGAANPVVWGRKLISEELPTVLFYGHYDVMPPDPIDEWTSPPFEPEVRNGELFGRGTADDKGQLLMHINAVEAYLAVKQSLPVNVIFAIEGEEEMGSEALNKLLDTDRDLFDAGVAVVSDSPFFDRSCPSICYGLRGIAVAEIRITGPCSDLHSGNFGGAVANPAEMLARIINDLKDRDGRVTIDGFYDDVVKLTPAEREAFAALPFDEEQLRRDTGVSALYGEQGFTTLERIWARPTFEVNGIGGGFQEAGSKTIVPSSAFAKLSMRLVPNQDPDRILQLLEQHLRKVTPPGVTLEIEPGHGGQPFVAPIDNPEVKAARRAMARGFDREVHYIRDGASIPIVADLSKKLGATCLLLGVDVPEGRIHAPNEKLVLDNFYKGTRTMAYLLEELAGQ
jgi:acetylornithine deacetylase/succinyl-diaminopimelate desuccinylase-like protein